MDWSFAGFVFWLLLAPVLLWRLERIDRRLRLLNLKENIQMATVNDLFDAVKKQKTVVDGIKVLVGELKANQHDPVKLDELLKELDANTADLATNLVANTPSEPTP